MGQTLTHGIYLPDEGERNCYAGLAGNWQLLDGAVGTIAEHTTQIAGKASASHSHGNISNDGKVGTTANLPLITGTDGVVQAGSFGNAANTFCEGNDSRLSDARTPLSHTHYKANITDLFNSANEWTQINTYTVALRFSAANYSAGTPSSDIFYGSVQWGGIVNNTFVQSFGINNAIRTSGINDISLRVWSQTGSILRGVAVETNADASNSSLRPLVNNVTDLGSTVYQWNNLYAKNYYYNGVAWGLDKDNTWTGANSFYKSIQIHGSRNAYIMPEFGASYSGLTFGTVEFKQSFKFGDWVDNNSTIGINTSNAYVEIYAGLDSSDSVNKARLNPVNTTVAELGTSTNKWKTLNGINPGALSLPNGNAQDTSWIGDLTIKDGSNYNLKTFALNGWITINIPNTAGNLVVVNNGCGQIVTNEAKGVTGGNCAVFIPVVANVQVSILLVLQTGESVKTAIFAPCLGNV